MPKPKDIENLRLKIVRFTRDGKTPPTGLVLALASLLKIEQKRYLRTMSNARFGRTKARELRRKGGEFAFD